MAAQILRFFFQKMSDCAPFGDQHEQNRAVEVVNRHLCGERPATLFLEYPLMGDAGFDVHVYPFISHVASEERGAVAEERVVVAGERCAVTEELCAAGEKQCAAEESFASEAPYSSFLQWCSSYPEGVAEGGFAYDLSRCKDTIPDPCLYSAFFTADKRAVPQSCAAMGAPQFTRELHRILSMFDKNHRVYYAGVMYGRDPLIAHIGYKAHGALREEYRNNPKLLFRHAQQLGFEFSDISQEAQRFQPFANLGFEHDIQYAFDERGVIANTLAFSYVEGSSPNENKQSMCEGGLYRVLSYLEKDAQLADNRWQCLEPALGFWLVPYQLDGQVRFAVLGASVGYVKIRWGAEGAQSAKLYISLGITPIKHKV